MSLLIFAGGFIAGAVAMFAFMLFCAGDIEPQDKPR